MAVLPAVRCFFPLLAAVALWATLKTQLEEMPFTKYDQVRWMG